MRRESERREARDKRERERERERERREVDLEGPVVAVVDGSALGATVISIDSSPRPIAIRPVGVVEVDTSLHREALRLWHLKGLGHRQDVGW